MTREDRSTHLNAEEIQAFLDGELSPDGADRVRNHTEGCPRCASELHAWQVLVAELDELPEVEPSPSFVERVMEEVPVRKPLRLRVWQGLAAFTGLSRNSGRGHLSTERLQDFVDDALPSGGRREVQAHLATCSTCRTAMHEWESLAARLSELPRLAPSRGFADQVMARVQVPERATAPARPGFLEVVGGLVPSTTRGWALTGLAAAVPAAAMALLAAYVLTHPVLGAGELASYTWWKATDLFSAGVAYLADWLVDQALAGPWLPVVEAVAASPATAFGALAAGWTLAAGAAWVLYRNLHLKSDTAESHVHA